MRRTGGEPIVAPSWPRSADTVAPSTTGARSRECRAEGRGWRFYVVIAALVLLLIFVIQNSQSVPVEFLFTTIDTPLFFALIVAGALGARHRLGGAASTPRRLPRRALAATGLVGLDIAANGATRADRRGRRAASGRR